MKLIDVQTILDGQVVCGTEWLAREVVTVCGSDLMSDVLAFANVGTLLLTGLTNIQVIRTAEMSDLVGIFFVQGKYPGPELIKMAEMKKIPLFVTKYSLYESCGKLYKYDIKRCHKSGEQL